MPELNAIFNHPFSEETLAAGLPPNGPDAGAKSAAPERAGLGKPVHRAGRNFTLWCFR
jgi:hypothetical protein